MFSENEVEITPDLLSSIADKLNKLLKDTPKSENKGGKAVLKKEKARKRVGQA